MPIINFVSAILKHLNGCFREVLSKWLECHVTGRVTSHPTRCQVESQRRRRGVSRPYVTTPRATGLGSAWSRKEDRSSSILDLYFRRCRFNALNSQDLLPLKHLKSGQTGEVKMLKVNEIVFWAEKRWQGRRIWSSKVPVFRIPPEPEPERSPEIRTDAVREWLSDFCSNSWLDRRHLSE